MRSKEIARFIEKKINEICRNERSAPATLANLRRGLGTMPGDRPELWAVLFDGLPEEMLSKSGQPTYAEWAIHTALTLFALHQRSKSVTEKRMDRQGESLGRALNRLAGNDDEAKKRIKRRFDALATADNVPEVVHHLRGLVQQLRAEDIPLDYPQLGVDIYHIQMPDSAPNVRLKWGQDFYRKRTKDNTDTNKE